MSVARRKQQEKQKKAEEERRLKEEADRLRQEEEQAKQAAAQEAQRLKREKQQAAQRERQAALREEQEAKAKARAASEKAEAAAKVKAMAKVEKANKASRSKENRDKERDAKTRKEREKGKEKEKKAGPASSTDVELSIQEPGFDSDKPLEKSQRAASRKVGGSPRGAVEEDAPSPTCPSTPLAGLSSLPLPPSMTSPPIGLQANSVGSSSIADRHGSSSSSAAVTAETVLAKNRAASGNSDSRNTSRSASSSTAWSPKDLHREPVVDAEGPLARLAIVSEEPPAEPDGGLGRLGHGSEKDDDVLRGLLHGVDPTEVNYTDESRGSSVDSSTAVGGGHKNGGWGSPVRHIGSPRFDHPIGSMWDDADPTPAPAPSAAPPRGAIRPPRNAMETAAAWPTVALESTKDAQGGPGGGGGGGSSKSWATGRLVGSSASLNSPDGSNTNGRDLGEEELPDWLLSTLGEMGGDGINSQENSKESDEPSSPVAQYLSQDTPAGPRRSDLKLAGRRGPTSPPHPALAGLGKTLAGSGDRSGGRAHTQQLVGAAGVSSDTPNGRLSPVQSVRWPPPSAFPPAPVAGNGSLAANGWSMAAEDNIDASSNRGGGSSDVDRGEAGTSKGWTVGTQRANIV